MQMSDVRCQKSETEGKIMSGIIELTEGELAELEDLRAGCLKKNGDFRKDASQENRDRLCVLDARQPESTADTEELPPPPPARGPRFRIDGADPYGLGALRCLNKLLAAQGAEPECLPMVLRPDDPNALAILENYRQRCAGAGLADAERLAGVEAAIKAFGGKL